jgi:hypothetical protein
MNTNFLLTTCALALVFTSNAQLNSGSYHFTDGAYYEVDLSVCEDSDFICDFTFFNDENIVATSSEGEWQRVNPNGVDEGYEGPSGWYNIQADIEYFEIEVVSLEQIIVIRGDNRIQMSKSPTRTGIK